MGKISEQDTRRPRYARVAPKIRRSSRAACPSLLERVSLFFPLFCFLPIFEITRSLNQSNNDDLPCLVLQEILVDPREKKKKTTNESIYVLWRL